MVTTRSKKRQSPSPPANEQPPAKAPRLEKSAKASIKQDLSDIELVLLDIEGTICPITFVKDTLFPYALSALPSMLATQWESPTFATYRNAFPEEHRSSSEALEAHVKDLTERDVKVAYLKNLQGYLWEDGYKSGAYATPLYDDVLEFFERWPSRAGQTSDSSIIQRAETANTKNGEANGQFVETDHNVDTNNDTNDDQSPKKRIAIYSSGSIFAQQLLFQHIRDLSAAQSATTSSDEETDHKPPIRDLSHLPIAYFDTTTAGLKHESSSYTSIAKSLDFSSKPEKILFLSDNTAEIYAALEAGMKAVVVEREGNKPLSEKERAELDVISGDGGGFRELGLY